MAAIFESKTLWASLATSLNDRSETQHAIALLERMIVRNLPQTKSLPIDRLPLTLKHQRWWRHYVVSFCGRNDTALHWLHYGRSGTGVALAFDSRALKREAQKHSFELYPVIYDERRQVARLTLIVEIVDEALGRGLRRLRGGADRQLLIDAALDLVANEIWRVAPRIKDPVFEPENEWRLVASIPQGGRGVEDPISPIAIAETCFRFSAGRLIPYKKLRIDPLPITAIVLGSSATYTQDPLTLEVLMEQTLGEAVDLLQSPVPVRP